MMASESGVRAAAAATMSIPCRDLGVEKSAREGEIAKSRGEWGGLIWQGDKTGETMTAMALWSGRGGE